MDLRDHWHARQPVWQPRQRFRTIEGRSSSVQVSDFDDAMKAAHYIVFVDRLANALQPNSIRRIQGHHKFGRQGRAMSIHQGQ